MHFGNPVAGIFPLMADDAVQALANAIRENGWRVAILRDTEGRIIDGRNRQTACVMAGVEPRYEVCRESRGSDDRGDGLDKVAAEAASELALPFVEDELMWLVLEMIV